MAKTPKYKKIQPEILHYLDNVRGLWAHMPDIAAAFKEGEWLFSRRLPDCSVETGIFEVTKASRTVVMKALKDLESQGLVKRATGGICGSFQWASTEALKKKDKEKAEAQQRSEKLRAEAAKRKANAERVAKRFERFGVQVAVVGGMDQQPALLIPYEQLSAFEEFMARAPKLAP